MHERTRHQAQREPPRTPAHRTSGFTLLEVMIAAAIAVVVIAGLAAATMGAARTNREAANLGAPERALHEALEHIAADLRTTNGDGAYRCGRPANQRTPLNINGYTIEWNTHRVTLNSNGTPVQQTSCGTSQQQSTLLVRATTQDAGATHTRETLVSLNRSTNTPRITSFTTNLTEVRPGETVTLNWQLAANPPAGTVTYLDGERVRTNPTTLRGSTTLQITETTRLELVADSPFGRDSRNLTIEAGSAPIFRVLRTTPERYTPGKPLTFHWEIDPLPLTLNSAQRVAAHGLPAHTIPTGANSTGRVTGSNTVNVPAAATGVLAVPFTASSRGGTTRKTLPVLECPLPVITLTPSATRITREGDINTNWTVTWKNSDAASVAATFDGSPVPIPANELDTGSRTFRVTAWEGSTSVSRFTLTAESDCGRSATAQVEVRLEAREIPPPPPPPPPTNPTDPGGSDPGDDDDPGGGGTNPEPTCDDLDFDTIYCACFEGPIIKCLPRGDGGDGGGGGGGDDPVVIEP